LFTFVGTSRAVIFAIAQLSCRLHYITCCLITRRQNTDVLTSEVSHLASSVKNLTSQLISANDDSLNQQFTGFLQVNVKLQLYHKPDF